MTESRIQIYAKDLLNRTEDPLFDFIRLPLMKLTQKQVFLPQRSGERAAGWPDQNQMIISETGSCSKFQELCLKTKQYK